MTTIAELLLTIENSTEIIVNWKHNNNDNKNVSVMSEYPSQTAVYGLAQD